VGFNVFGHDIGPAVQRAPEHSDTFRRKVQLQRALGSNRSVSMERVRNNKALTKLLVLAKREKIKHEYALAQRKLQEEIPAMLPATVQSLMDQFGIDFSVSQDSSQSNVHKKQQQSPSITWPNPTDVHVYINQGVQDGVYQVETGDRNGEEQANSMISIHATISLASETCK